MRPINLTILSFSLLLTSTVSANQWPETETESTPKVAPKPQVQTPAPVIQNTPATVAKAPSPYMAYMGMGVDLLPQSVIAQMPKGVSTGEGIMITRFTSSSPAEKSDIRAYDILLAYDEHKILHPTQFITLVRNDKPGRTVKLKLVRNGQVIVRPVILGSQKRPTLPNGLSIKQLGDNLYMASIRFKDASGKQQQRQYKGTRQQIYYQALKATDLPKADKAQILYAAGGTEQKESKSFFESLTPFGNKNGNGNGNNNWGSFFPFGNNKQGGNNNSFFPFSR